MSSDENNNNNDTFSRYKITFLCAEYQINNLNSLKNRSQSSSAARSIPTTSVASQQANSFTDESGSQHNNVDSNNNNNPKTSKSTPIRLISSTSHPAQPTKPVSKNSTNSSNLRKKSDKIAENIRRRFIQIAGHTNVVYSVCFDRTGKYIFTVTSYNNLYFLNF